jgi:DNA-binding transcriptional LysR family regulator
LREARAALAQAAFAVETAKRAARGEVGTLRLSFITSAPLTPVFTRAVREFRLATPDVHLELQVKQTQQILDDLLLHHVDLGIIRPARSTKIATTLKTILLLRDRLMLVVPADHALAAHDGPIPMRLLADERFILKPRSSGAGYYEQVFELCAQAGFTPHIAQEATEASTTLGLIAAGLGITIAPDSLQSIDTKDIAWRELDLGDEAASLLLLVFNQDQVNTPRDKFVAILQSSLSAAATAAADTAKSRSAIRPNRNSLATMSELSHVGERRRRKAL